MSLVTSTYLVTTFEGFVDRELISEVMLWRWCREDIVQAIIE